MTARVCDDHCPLRERACHMDAAHPRRPGATRSANRVPTGQPPRQLRQPGNQRAVLANDVLAIAAAISGLVVQHGFMLRTRPLPVLGIVMGLYGALAAAKYHERASYHLLQARALARRWRSSARLTTANASRLSRLRLHQLWTRL